MSVKSDKLIAAVLALRPHVLRWLCKWYHPVEDQEDAAQEILDLAVRRLSYFRHGGLDELRGWLYVLALREALRRRKSRAKYVDRGLGFALVSSLGSMSSLVSTSPSPEELYGHREALRIALDELKAMDSRLLSVFVAVDLEGLTEAQAAEEFGIPCPTVKSRLRRARVFAREALEPRRHELLVVLPPAIVAALLSTEAQAAPPPPPPQKKRWRSVRPHAVPATAAPPNAMGPTAIGGALGFVGLAGVLVTALLMPERPDAIIARTGLPWYRVAAVEGEAVCKDEPIPARAAPTHTQPTPPRSKPHVSQHARDKVKALLAGTEHAPEGHR
jgi:RNA polymerase sigma-70 factor (ECF subfamily)